MARRKKENQTDLDAAVEAQKRLDRRGKLAALTARRLLALCKNLRHAKMVNGAVYHRLCTGLEAACYHAVFADKLFKLGGQCANFMNDVNTDHSYEFALTELNHVRRVAVVRELLDINEDGEMLDS